MTKGSFIFYRSFAEVIDELPDEDQLKLYRAIKEYALNEKEIELTGISKSFFKLMKPVIASNNRKYHNGIKGGRPPNQDKPNGNQDETKEEPKPNQDITKPEPNGNQTETKPKPNDNDNVNVNEKENGVSFSEKPKSKKDATTLFQTFREVWNEAGIKPECRDLIIPPAKVPEYLQTLSNYAPDEIINAIKNFGRHKKGEYRNYRPPLPYGSIYGFLSKGVARYFDNAAMEQQFSTGPPAQPDHLKEQTKELLKERASLKADDKQINEYLANIERLKNGKKPITKKVL